MTENHTKMYGICENKCFVEVSPKTDTDAVKDRVDSLEDNTVKKTGNETISGAKTFNSVLTINPGADWRTLIMNTNIKKTGENGKTFLLIYDDDNYPLSSMQSMYSIVGNLKQARTLLSSRIRKSDNSEDVWATVRAIATDNGMSYALAPRTPERAASDEIITANALNSWASVVHTVGNEEISGAKTFTSTPAILSADPIIKVKNTSMDVTTGSNPKYGTIQILDKNGVVAGAIFEEVVNGNSTLYLRSRTLINGNKSDAEIKIFSNANGSKYATAPTTPSNANGNEIATAGWVKNTINSTVPVSKHTMVIDDEESLIDALTAMKNGAIGNIVVYAVKGSNHYNFTVTGYLDGNTTIWNFASVGVGGNDSRYNITDVYVEDVEYVGKRVYLAFNSGEPEYAYNFNQILGRFNYFE